MLKLKSLAAAIRGGVRAVLCGLVKIIPPVVAPPSFVRRAFRARQCAAAALAVVVSAAPMPFAAAHEINPPNASHCLTDVGSGSGRRISNTCSETVDVWIRPPLLDFSFSETFLGTISPGGSRSLSSVSGDTTGPILGFACFATYDGSASRIMLTDNRAELFCSHTHSSSSGGGGGGGGGGGDDDGSDNTWLYVGGGVAAVGLLYLLTSDSGFVASPAPIADISAEGAIYGARIEARSPEKPGVMWWEYREFRGGHPHNHSLEFGGDWTESGLFASAKITEGDAGIDWRVGGGKEWQSGQWALRSGVNAAGLGRFGQGSEMDLQMLVRYAANGWRVSSGFNAPADKPSDAEVEVRTEWNF